MSGRTFPVMTSHWRREVFDEIGGRGAVVRSIPWEMAEEARTQAERNHSQTLERLAERGGLSPAEMVCAIEGKRLFGRRFEELLGASSDPTRSDVVGYHILLDHLKAWEAR